MKSEQGWENEKLLGKTWLASSVAVPIIKNHDSGLYKPLISTSGRTKSCPVVPGRRHIFFIFMFRLYLQAKITKRTHLQSFNQAMNTFDLRHLLIEDAKNEPIL